MARPKALKFLLAASVLLSASPAMASDFSGLIYFFAAIVVVVGLFAGALVFAFRSIAGSGGPVVDAISAVTLSLALAPAGLVNQFGETDFVPLPGWMLAVFEFGSDDLMPGYAFSLLVTAAAFFVLFRAQRMRRDRGRDT